MMPMVEDREEGFQALVRVRELTHALCAHAELGEIQKVEELLQERGRLLGQLPQLCGIAPGEGEGTPRGMSTRFAGILENIRCENDSLMKLLKNRKTQIVDQARELRLSRQIVNYRTR